MKICTKSELAIIFAALLLGLIGIIVKSIGDSISIATLNFFRMFFGMLFLLIIIPLIDKNTFKVTKGDLKEFFVIGALFAIALSLFTTANLFAPVQNVVLIHNLFPFFVLPLAYFLLKEKITKTKLITLGIAFVGIVIINPLQAGDAFFGNMLALGNAIFFALLVVFMRISDKDHTTGNVFWFLFFATLILFPFFIMFGLNDIAAIVSVLPLLVILGFVSTGLAYLLYNLGLEHIEAEKSAIIETIFTPIFSIGLAVFIISEQLSPQTILGGAVLIIAGIYLQIHQKKIPGKTKKVKVIHC
jgi:drug/metabolite transporter (DMT)-like permease